MSQFCYNVMGQGLTGAPPTYSRLKDIAIGCIPAPKEEEAIHGKLGTVAYEYFMDDDYGAAVTFQDLFDFLHERYFPRVSWARLTLKPKKTRFFSRDIEILGHEISGCTGETDNQEVGLKLSKEKVSKFASFPVPTNEAEVDQFLYMTTYLKRYISGRAEHAKVLKDATKWNIVKVTTGKR